MKKLLLIGLLTLSIFGFIGNSGASAYTQIGLSIRDPRPHGTYYSQAYAKNTSSTSHYRARLYGIRTNGSRVWTSYYGSRAYRTISYTEAYTVWHPSAHIMYVY